MRQLEKRAYQLIQRMARQWNVSPTDVIDILESQLPPENKLVKRAVRKKAPKRHRPLNSVKREIQNSRTLAGFIQRTLRDSQNPMDLNAIARAVNEQGYKSKSANFELLVQRSLNALYLKGRVEKVKQSYKLAERLK